MNFSEAVFIVLDQALKRAGSAAKLSRAANVTPQTMSKWISRQSVPSVVEMGKVLDYMGVNILSHASSTDYREIPYIEAQPGAGSSLVTADTVLSMVPVTQRFLTDVHASSNSVFMRVLGDSMEPQISNGDTVLVDRDDTEIRDAKIFIVGFGEELLVKAVQKRPHGLLLVSRNPQYPPIEIKESDMDVFRVYGRVRWSSHMYM